MQADLQCDAPLPYHLGPERQLLGQEAGEFCWTIGVLFQRVLLEHSPDRLAQRHSADIVRDACAQRLWHRGAGEEAV
jgi:hypothetical protein